MPLMDKSPSPETLLEIGVKDIKSRRQCVKAAVAPVSMIIATESVSNVAVHIASSAT